MTKSLRCPFCAAPLEIEDRYSDFDRCEFCGDSILLSPESDLSNETPSGTNDFLLEQARKLKEIKQMALSGKAIQAIKTYRDTFGTGLKEAKEAIDNIVAGKPIVFTKEQVVSAGNVLTGKIETVETSVKFAEIQSELERGNKINAIKIYRETFGGGLKEAKDAVDEMERGSTKSFGQFNNEAFKKKNNSSSITALAIILSAILLIILVSLGIYVMIKDY